MRESPIEVLERWERYGALWRARHVSDELAIVDLCTCHGEPVDVRDVGPEQVEPVERLESHDAELIAYLRQVQRDDP